MFIAKECLETGIMVSAPPKIMGGPANFFPNYLGFFLTLGGPNLMGGSLDMMGGVPILDRKNIFQLYVLLLACDHYVNIM